MCCLSLSPSEVVSIAKGTFFPTTMRDGRLVTPQTWRAHCSVLLCKDVVCLSHVRQRSQDFWNGCIFSSLYNSNALSLLK